MVNSTPPLPAQEYVWNYLGQWILLEAKASKQKQNEGQTKIFL